MNIIEDNESEISLRNYSINIFIYNQLVGERTNLLKNKPKGYKAKLEDINADIFYIEGELTGGLKYHAEHGTVN